MHKKVRFIWIRYLSILINHTVDFTNKMIAAQYQWTKSIIKAHLEYENAKNGLQWNQNTMDIKLDNILSDPNKFKQTLHKIGKESFGPKILSSKWKTNNSHKWSECIIDYKINNVLKFFYSHISFQYQIEVFLFTDVILKLMI